MDVVLFEGAAAEIITDSPVTGPDCGFDPCPGEDQTPIAWVD
jgi:hypothetical protein